MYNTQTMIEPREEKSDDDTNKPLAWFFIVMILLNPFLAPLLAVLLKANIEPKVTVLDDEIPEEEPDVPWDFFESIDRTLSFPMASAESLPSSNLLTVIPEFLTGTTKHTQEMAEAMKKNMGQITHPIKTLLEKNSGADEVVIGVSENHIQSHNGLISVIDLLMVWKKFHPNTHVIFIQECIGPDEMFTKIQSELERIFDRFHHQKTSEKEINQFFEQRCFNSPFENNVSQKTFYLKYCLALAVKSRQFDFAFTRNKPLSTKQKALIEHYRNPKTGVIPVGLSVKNEAGEYILTEVFREASVFPAEMRHSDHAIISTFQQQRQIQKTKHPTAQKIFVILFGVGHTKSVDRALKEMKLPHVLLYFQPLPRNPDIDALIQNFAKACVKALEKCPSSIQKSVKNLKGEKPSHCVLLDDKFDSTTCDTVLHEKHTEHTSRINFNKGLAHKIEPALPLHYPRSNIAFFSPVDSINYADNILNLVEKDPRPEL